MDTKVETVGRRVNALAHSSSLELSLKNDVYQYFPTPKSQ